MKLRLGFGDFPTTPHPTFPYNNLVDKKYYPHFAHAGAEAQRKGTG